jgi:hypothetical protein
VSPIVTDQSVSNWKKKEAGFLHFLCGDTGFDERGVFFLKTGAGPKNRLRIVDVVQLFLHDMNMQQVCVVLDGLPYGEYASRVVASVTASLEHACRHFFQGQSAVKKVAVAISAGGCPGAFEDALLESLAQRSNVQHVMRQLFASTAGRDVTALQRDEDEAGQVHFAARVLEAASRVSGGKEAAEDPAEVTIVFHQGLNNLADTRNWLPGCGTHATVIPGSWQGDDTYGQKTVLPALMHDLCHGDTTVYERMRSILMELLCSDGLLSSSARLLATQCTCVCLTEEGEPEEGGEHLVAAVAMLTLLHDDLLHPFWQWPRAVALSAQLQDLRRAGCDLRSRSHDPHVLLAASAGAATAKSQASSGRCEVPPCCPSHSTMFMCWCSCL